MPKSSFQDIVPPDRKSIKKIPIPERRGARPEPVRGRSRAVQPQPVSLEPRENVYRLDIDEDAPSEPRIRREAPREPARPPVRERAPEPERIERVAPPRVSSGRRSFFSWKVITIFIVAILAIGGTVYFMSRTAGARVVVTPRTQPITVDAQFTAYKNSATTSDAVLTYQTVTLSKEGKTEVPATGQEDVSVKASGVIIIYNNFSATPQKLIANTRFQTAAGLIFRISNPVTVPGKSGSTPGSVEALVTADKAGADYNVGLTDFSIPGFQDDAAKYKGFYARSKATIAGGFVGTRAKVDPSQVGVTVSKIKDELKTALVTQAKGDIPPGFVLPENAYVIEYEDLPQTKTESGGAQIGQRATLHGLIFKKNQLAAQLSKKANGTTDTSQTEIGGTNNLVFTAKAAGTSTALWNLNNVNFGLKGTTTLISEIDTVSLQNQLATKPRKNLNAILAGYPAVAKAEVTMWPFWRSTFPASTTQITIVVTNPALSP
jgi:hypothetical protein